MSNYLQTTHPSCCDAVKNTPIPEPTADGFDTLYSPAFGQTFHSKHGDATKAPLPAPPFDAVYLDAFSPDANPALWTPAFLARLFAAMRPGATLAT